MKKHNNKTNGVTSYAFEHLAVEIAGRFQGDDVTYPPYEYLPEAHKLCQWLMTQEPTPSAADIADKFAEICVANFGAPFDPATFMDTAEFTVSRLTSFRNFYQDET